MNSHKRITAKTVRQICGDVSDMWIWRRLNEPESGFPKPVYIGRRRFWREAEILEWLDGQSAQVA
ncbi:transcriptional regulator, AlpA family [Shimia gijangensis]|uniref:Transcriptional regulator, AlpA family n=1 Tax=Shimia gijangensis TaxID=1470563 RepID=A0A1M6HC97_9RHOB|nr:AlpA family phage regulatory protein [Shimia gijangensis]SHJ19719.1 transcriptional regulator, AlpA family [Shimia gijangensis]